MKELSSNHWLFRESSGLPILYYLLPKVETNCNNIYWEIDQGFTHQLLKFKSRRCCFPPTRMLCNENALHGMQSKDQEGFLTYLTTCFCLKLWTPLESSLCVGVWNVSANWLRKTFPAYHPVTGHLCSGDPEHQLTSGQSRIIWWV